jgi:ADP-ribose pyrophosphatase
VEHDPAENAAGNLIAFDGQRFKVRIQTVPHPLGGVRRFEIVDTPAAAAVVPVLAGEGAGEPRVVLVEQERPALGRRTLEIPAGVVVPAEQDQPQQTALRELEEETGYTAQAAQLLTSISPSPGISTEIIHIYLATDLAPASQTPGPMDPTEIAMVRTLPLGEALRMVMRGEIQDAKTVVGLLLAYGALAAATRRQDQTPDAGGEIAMPVDPTAIPFVPIETRAASGDNPAALSLEAIASQEFSYANVTAYQAMEDRARFFGLYLTLVGVLAAALGAVSQLGGGFDNNYLLPIAIFLLLLAGGLGAVFFTMLIRLRQAWRNSALAMHRIKEYYIEHLRPAVPDIDKAFFWRLETLPKGEKRGSGTYLVCYTTALIGSLCFAAAVFLLGVEAIIRGWGGQVATNLSLGQTSSWIDPATIGVFSLLALIVFLVSLRKHVRYYNKQLSDRTEAQAIQGQEQILQAGKRR